jgi:hypothetical protein
MNFEEYWKTTELGKVSPEILSAAFKEVAQDAWDAGFDVGYEWRERDTAAEYNTDRGHLNP